MIYGTWWLFLKLTLQVQALMVYFVKPKEKKSVLLQRQTCQYLKLSSEN